MQQGGPATLGRDSTTVTVHVTRSSQPPSAPGGPQPHMPYTGLATAALLLLALALLALGAVLTRAGRSSTRRFSMSRRAAIAAGVVIVAAAAVAPAFADSASTTVTMAASGGGTRQLDLLDLAGQPLTNLSLMPGTPQAFRVRVTDNQIGDLTTGFHVSATMSNMYRSDGAGGYVWADKVRSSDIAMSYATNPFSALGLSYDALPKVSLSGALPSCPDLVLDGLSLTTLTNAGLCSIVGTVAGVSYSLPSPVVVQSTLDTVVSGAIRAPYDLTGNESGNFPTADFSTGIGLQAAPHDSTYVAGTPGTPRSVMVGTFTGVSNLLSDINAAVAAASSGLAPVSATGTGAYASVSSVVSGLMTQGQSALANALSQLTAADQATVLGGLTATLVTPTVSQLTKEIGTYNAFPALTVNPPAATPGGTYKGTLTVTMVQP